MYHEFGPPSSLTPWVDHFWSSTGPRTRGTIISPDGCIDIIVTPSAGTAKVVGAMTRSIRLPGGSLVAGVHSAEGEGPVIFTSEDKLSGDVSLHNPDEVQPRPLKRCRLLD